MIVSRRKPLVYWAHWAVAHTNEIHYTESGTPPDARQMVLSAHKGQLPLWTDCSGAVTTWYKWAGLPDPNGLGYRYLGYTGTLLANGKQIEKRFIARGDVIVYGPGTGWHTALVVEPGSDPLTVSHGGPGGPSYVRVSQDGREPQRYLRFATTVTVPNPVVHPFRYFKTRVTTVNATAKGAA